RKQDKRPSPQAAHLPTPFPDGLVVSQAGQIPVSFRLPESFAFWVVHGRGRLRTAASLEPPERLSAPHGRYFLRQEMPKDGRITTIRAIINTEVCPCPSTHRLRRIVSRLGFGLLATADAIPLALKCARPLIPSTSCICSLT